MAEVPDRGQRILAAGVLGNGQFQHRPKVKIQAIPAQPGVNYVPAFTRAEDFDAFERLARAHPPLVEPIPNTRDMWRLTDQGRKRGQQALADLGTDAVIGHGSGA